MNARRALPALVVGDTLSFLAFAALGRAEHASGLALVAVLTTAAPFLIVWYPVAVWLRAFSPAAVAAPLTSVRRILLPWLLAWPLGLQLRALLEGRSIPFSFAVVALLTNLLLLGGWRALYAAWLKRRV